MRRFLFGSVSYGILSKRRLNRTDIDVPGGGDAIPIQLGALALEGDGGIPKPDGALSIADAGGTNLVLAGSEAVPGAGGGLSSGTVLWDDGTEWAVTAIANKYSCRADTAEINAAWADADPATARGLLVHDGDTQASIRLTLSGKAFANTFTIEPSIWTQNSDPRATFRSTKLPGITLSASTENVTVQGLDLYDDDAGIGVVEITRPSKNVIVRQNRIHSADLATEHAAGRMAAGTMPTIEGVSDGGGTGQHARLKIDENYIHDVTRGAELLYVTDNASGPSSVNSNRFVDCYQFFTLFSYVETSVGALAATCYDNWGMHVWSTTADSLGEHSSVGGSIDPNMDGVAFMGNKFHVGWHRKLLEPGFVSGATGIKANNPLVTNSYRNITFAFNLIVTHGLSLEMAGADGFAMFNNTFLSEDYNGGTIASLSLEGAANGKVYRNLGENFGVGTFDGASDKGDGDVPFVRTLDTLEGYSNICLTADASDFGRDTILPGISGNFDELTMEQLEEAFTPNAGTYASESKAGALGTGYYSGMGVHTAPAYSARAATGGTPYAAAMTTWDGSTYATRSGLSNVTDSGEITFAWEGALHADTDGADFFLFHETGYRVSVRRLPSGKLRIYAENAAGAKIIEADTIDEFDSSRGTFRMAFSADLADGRLLLAIDGKTAPMAMNISTGTLLDDDIYFTGMGAIYIGTDATGATNKFKGDFGQLLLMDEFVDLDTVAGLNQLFASTGAFVDWGATGANISAGTKPVVFRGNASAINGGTGNGGDGGAFTIGGGTVSDVGAGSAPVNTVAPVVSGDAEEGSVLSVTTGTWTGSPAPTFTYQWTADGVDISGETGSTYTTDTDNVGEDIGCDVTGTSASGSATEASNEITVTAGVPAGYTANAVKFDGTNDWLWENPVNTPTPAASKELLITWWMYAPASFPSSGRIIGLQNSGGTDRVTVTAVSSGRMTCTVKNAAGTNVAIALCSSGSLTADTWHFCALQVNTAEAVEADRIKIIVDGSEVSGYDVRSATLDGLVEGGLARASIGASGEAGGTRVAEWWASDLYINMGETLDLTNSTNREKFRSAAGKPVNLGSDGSTPTGSVPHILFSNAFATWHQDVSGNGNTLTVVGALEAAASSPSD